MAFEIYYRVRDYFKFSIREQKELLISAILFGFILSFRMWGGKEFDAWVGIKNLIIASIFILIVLIWHISWQKIFALNEGYRTHYHWWFPGILISLFIAFITYGYVPFLYPGHSYYEFMKRLRLGRFRYGINIKDLVVPAVAGVVSSVVLALLMSFVYLATKSYWVLFFIKLNFLYAFLSMLPIPRIEGIKMGGGSTVGFYIFFFGRPLYVFMLISLILYAWFVYYATTVLGSFLLLLLAMILGLIVMFVFLKVVEKVVW